jgi:metal-dependent amidase/aminoacylase/carboxypeptidase family protein
VTGLIRGGKGEGRVLMVRADMDALPILEENDVPYKSQQPGVMHACGHDAHTAMLMGLTRLLVDRKAEFAGTVKVLFQPAEEVPPGGAIAMIKDGALEDPRVDAAFGLHVSSETPAGQIAMRQGPGSPRRTGSGSRSRPRRTRRLPPRNDRPDRDWRADRQCVSNACLPEHRPDRVRRCLHHRVHWR